MSIINEISENLQKGKAKIVKELVEKAIADGVPAVEILDLGLLDGMNIIGEKFVKAEGTDIAARIENNVTEFLKTL